MAILDTGVEAGHALFTGRVVSEACYSTSSALYTATTLCPNNQEAMVGAGAASPTKCSGISGCDHGTHVAGIAAGAGASFDGVARRADVIAVQIFSRFDDSEICGGASSCVLSFSSDQIAGLERVYELRSSYDIAAVNLSLGGGRYTRTCDGASPGYTDIVETLQSVGIATVIASGNSYYTNGTSFPACISSAVTVGAVWDNDTVASFSNSASWVDLLAPGGGVQSSVTGGGFGSKSGTSMATPHVAGAFAVLRSGDPSASVNTILDALVLTGRAVTDPKSAITTPRIEVGLAVADLVPDVSPPEITSTSLPPAVVGVPYSQPVAVTGGSLPLHFQKTGGLLAAGLDLDPDTGTVAGIPTIAGTFNFAVEVTDALARKDAGNLTLSVKLPRPGPASPSGSIAEAKPTFLWSSSAGATGYWLVVDNETDGTTAIDSVVATTSFTPSMDLITGKDYAWRARAFDGSGNLSDFSDDLLFDIDTEAPAAAALDVGPLMVYSDLPASAADSSGAIKAERSADMALDGDPSSFWSTPGRAAPQEESLVADLGSLRTVGRIQLLSRAVTGATFPADFQIQISSDGETFITVADVVDYTAAAGTTHDFTFGAAVARFVRLRVLRVRPYTDGRYYVQLAEMSIGEPNAVPRKLVIRWDAPGDDGLTGTATNYDLRWSLTPIDAGTFADAQPVPSVPAPSPAGMAQSVLFEDLSHETRYYFALQTEDDVGNFSSLSTGEGVTAGSPPAPITDLSTINAQATSVELVWTATGEDGLVGTADHYEVRYAPFPISADIFDSATLVTSNVPSPAPSGDGETLVAEGLALTSTLYFAIKVFDVSGNESGLSNIAVTEAPDVTPPAQVTLSGRSGLGFVLT